MSSVWLKRKEITKTAIKTSNTLLMQFVKIRNKIFLFSFIMLGIISLPEQYFKSIEIYGFLIYTAGKERINYETV